MVGRSSHLGDPVYQLIWDVSQREKLDFDMMVWVANCESGIDHEQIGLAYEFGLYQFKKRTFYAYCRGEWIDIKHQIQCFAEMMNNDLGGHWTCYRKYDIK